MLIFVNVALSSCLILAVAPPKLVIIVPLLIVCLAIVVAIAVAASRGKFHMPGYIGLAFSSFAAAMVVGKILGAHTISGTAAGLLLSMLFFLSIATTLGSLVALLFYQPAPDRTK